MKKKDIPFYASALAQSFINFEPDEDERENINDDPELIKSMLAAGYTIDDIALLDVVDMICWRSTKKAEQAAKKIKHKEARQDAERCIECYRDRCIR